MSTVAYTISELLLLLGFIFTGCLFNGPYDTVVSGAAADIAFDMVANLVFIGIGHLFQQIPPHQHHTRCAESALDSIGIQKSFLQGGEGTVRRSHTFNGGDLGAIHGNGQGQAP